MLVRRMRPTLRSMTTQDMGMKNLNGLLDPLKVWMAVLDMSEKTGVVGSHRRVPENRKLLRGKRVRGQGRVHGRHRRASA